MAKGRSTRGASAPAGTRAARSASSGAGGSNRERGRAIAIDRAAQNTARAQAANRPPARAGLKPLSGSARRAVGAAQSARRPTRQQRELRQAAAARAALVNIRRRRAAAAQ